MAEFVADPELLSRATDKHLPTEERLARHKPYHTYSSMRNLLAAQKVSYPFKGHSLDKPRYNAYDFASGFEVPPSSPPLLLPENSR